MFAIMFVVPGSQFVLHGDEARKDAKPFAGVEARHFSLSGGHIAIAEWPQAERSRLSVGS